MCVGLLIYVCMQYNKIANMKRMKDIFDNEEEKKVVNEANAMETNHVLEVLGYLTREVYEKRLTEAVLLRVHICLLDVSISCACVRACVQVRIRS